ncbi:HlyD family efflux transporter periplasmic adaptor subunit [Sphingomonas koreensis]|uniref:HlyD family secretion protein n=1 Tax=Sphingomonas koreensis TaxID=93064 RepID=UPI00082E7FFD|nr:HlyD family efflux transporter periplasmic adaptor subunit [Sphingomonas koreensis]PJI90884.1 HlyD family secretion protein [Sphingomonas koreensis]RSU60149.1 HlyD family efflux transporter periplasmic adaptor subunit [Sphingomonas koreensis]RSU68089.1 HlyD family efflux transporter periplasmic adaptor subunit [Sphingomonas koreensis]
MKRILPLAAIGIAVLAALIWWAFGRDEGPEPWLGYVEGEAIEVAAPVSGQLAALNVQRGGQVTAGQPLFALNAATTEAELKRLRAQLASAQAQRDDLAKARQRPAELDIARAQQAAARAEVTRTAREYQRIATLAQRGFATKSQLDAARAAADGARASLSQAQASEASGKLAGRVDQIAAADAQIAAAQAAIAVQSRRGEEIAPLAPAAGLVEQTYFNPGEWVPANTPVVRLLPPGRVKIRFYAPQAAVAGLKPGSKVTVTCDGCGGPVAATVRYVAAQAEFTPPVIYSERARAKLVFLVEAYPDSGIERFRPGLPVEVQPQ